MTGSAIDGDAEVLLGGVGLATDDVEASAGARVAVGALARNFLSEFSIEVHSHVTNIGGVQSCIAGPIDWNLVEDSPARCADPDASQKMIKAIDDAREAGDSLGGIVEIIATGLRIGLGSHIQWDRKLSTRLAAAAMSMNAVKGVEFGVGFAQAEIPGSGWRWFVRQKVTRLSLQWPTAFPLNGGS